MIKLYAFFTVVLMSIPAGCDRDKGEGENEAPVDKKILGSGRDTGQTEETRTSNSKDSEVALNDFLDPFLVTANESLPCPAHLGMDEDHRKVTPCEGQITHSLDIFKLVKLKSSIADLKRQGGFGKGGWYLTSDTRIHESEDRQTLVLSSLLGQRLVFKRKDNGRTFVSTMMPSDHLLKYSHANTAELTYGFNTMNFERIEKNQLGVVKISNGKDTLTIGRNQNGNVTSLQSSRSNDTEGLSSERSDLYYEGDKVIRINSGNATATFSYQEGTLYKISTVSPLISSFTRITADTDTGLVAAISSSLGDSSQFGYYKMIDGSFAVSEIVDSNNHATKFEYSKNQVRETNLTAITDTVYDTKNRPVSLTENGLTEKFTYDERDNILTREDYMKRVYSYQYDGNDRVIEIQSHATGVVTRINRDSSGKIVEIRDTLEGRTRSLSFLRDSKGRVTSRIENGIPSLSSITYFEDGKVKSSSSPQDEIAFLYDDQYRVTSVSSQRNGTKTTLYSQNNSYSVLDEFGRSTTHSYTKNSSSTKLPNGNRLDVDRNNGKVSTELTGPINALKRVQSTEISGGVQNFEEVWLLNNSELKGNRHEYLSGLHKGSFKDSYLTDVLRDPASRSTSAELGPAMALSSVLGERSSSSSETKSPVSSVNTLDSCNCTKGSGERNGTANQYDSPTSGSQ